MKRRREHGECETRLSGRGCLVFGTRICEYRKKREIGIKALLGRWGGWLTAGGDAVLILFALLGVLVGLFWGKTNCSGLERLAGIW